MLLVKTTSDVDRLSEPIWRGESCPVCYEPWMPSSVPSEAAEGQTELIHADECWLMRAGKAYHLGEPVSGVIVDEQSGWIFVETDEPVPEKSEPLTA